MRPISCYLDFVYTLEISLKSLTIKKENFFSTNRYYAPLLEAKINALKSNTYLIY